MTTDNVIKTIKVIVYGFPKNISVVLRTYIKTFTNLQAGVKLGFKGFANVKPLTQINAVIAFIDTFHTFVKSSIQLNAGLKLGASPQTKIDTFLENNAISKFEANPVVNIKTHTSLTAIVARFYVWNDRKSQTFNDVSNLSIQEFVMQIIE